MIYKAGTPEYRAAHREVERVRGKAADYLCQICDRPAEEWSSSGRRMDLTQEYEALCRLCHRRKDQHKVDHPYDPWPNAQGCRTCRKTPEAKARQAEADKAYYDRNAERLRALARARYRRNRKKILAQKRERYTNSD